MLSLSIYIYYVVGGSRGSFTSIILMARNTENPRFFKEYSPWNSTIFVDLLVSIDFDIFKGKIWSLIFYYYILFIKYIIYIRLRVDLGILIFFVAPMGRNTENLGNFKDDCWKKVFTVKFENFRRFAGFCWFRYFWWKIEVFFYY